MKETHYIIRANSRLHDCCYFGPGGRPLIKDLRQDVSELPEYKESGFLDDAMYYVLLSCFGTGQFSVVGHYRVHREDIR